MDRTGAPLPRRCDRCQRVLEQIVATGRQEVQPFGEHAERKRGGRYLDHAGERTQGRARQDGHGFEDAEGNAHEFACDYVIMATGKRPLLEPLRLNKVGVAVENGVITADARCRTSVPHIFGVGDVIGCLMLAHTAGQQGRVAAVTILGSEASLGRNKFLSLLGFGGFAGAKQIPIPWRDP